MPSLNIKEDRTIKTTTEMKVIQFGSLRLACDLSFYFFFYFNTLVSRAKQWSIFLKRRLMCICCFIIIVLFWFIFKKICIYSDNCLANSKEADNCVYESQENEGKTSWTKSTLVGIWSRWWSLNYFWQILREFDAFLVKTALKSGLSCTKCL